MKRFAYYPGCSLETTAAAYHVSAVEVAARLGVEFVEVEDWNCCGATSYSGIDDLLGHTLCARNLAIAERSGLDIVAPCNACYKNLHSANDHVQHDPDLAEHINFALEADELSYAGKTSVHHLMHMFVGSVGLPAIKAQVTHPLAGLKVAPYYGCLLVRPRRDDAWSSGEPRFFEDLLRTLGATALAYPFRMRCCGASLIASNRRAALAMLRDLLRGARQVGADVIATACPLCQFNLECYQGEVNREFGTDFAIPIVYFTQLMGVALGIAPKDLGFGGELIPVEPVLACAARKPAAAKASHGPKVTTP
jgi:heterodisulfide reductase subunit B